MTEHQHQHHGAGQQFAWQPPAAPQPTTPQPLLTPGYPGYGGLPAPAEQRTPRRGSRLRIGLAGLVAGAVIGGGAGAGVVALVDEPAAGTGSPASAQSVTIENPDRATTATAAAAKAAPSVVTVYVSSGSGAGSGSGVVLTADGYVLTNNHVIAEGASGAGAVQVRTADGTLYDAEIVGTDPASDLAVLRLDGAEDLVAATFADSDEVQIGDVAVAIGAPLGLSNTVTDGIISATGRAVATGSTQDDATVLDAIQTDAAINPGNSGGALVDGAGEVIGINTAIATVASGLPGGQGQSGNIGVGFAIPANTAQRVAQQIIETGDATRAYLGVRASTAADDQNREVGTGAEVALVEPGSAAEEGGLRVGDVVTAVGERPVTTSTELTAAIRSEAPGDTVELTVRRGGDTRTVEVVLGETD
ncbi:PDZ domain-containing protein [Blastococcus sp. MG754426]|uniref:S1C family serine protease n=1 Tax=unclassified Blastococcus TaxID=2619396 RepID=UPI001EEFB073|nr:MULTISPECIES: trypsin-like peptidase domain-containing protein [unclassified Blastococcus]MCF6506197.1 PDZ domain-containing protein [Blastococcus sp. MG754426]MCF6510425.1 PDZ domain-containing protein [Blastococcus sp. MG754427]MCF6737644.1 PDZ domain-containing protein [Blastococcus sp. KM273129]